MTPDPQPNPVPPPKMNRHKKIEDVLNPMYWLRNRCLPLFVALVVMLVSYPIFAGGNRNWELVGLAMFAVLPAFGVISLAGKTGSIISISALIIFMTGALFKSQIDLQTGLIGWPGLFVISYYSYSTYVVSRALFRSDANQPDRILGGISVYLLIGIIFSIIHHRISEEAVGAYQNSLSAKSPIQSLVWDDFLYYSFCTLTTVGYGDIVPVSVRARSTSILESAIGVLYPAILIARLVTTPTQVSHQKN